jgi:hypothetical protein
LIRLQAEDKRYCKVKGAGLTRLKCKLGGATITRPGSKINFTPTQHSITPSSLVRAFITSDSTVNLDSLWPSQKIIKECYFEISPSMTEMAPQDPILSPDSEPDDENLVDVVSEPAVTMTLTTTSLTMAPDDTTTKLLQVQHQTIKDALGNIGEYTGQLDLESNMPHGNGEMKYVLSENDQKTPSAETSSLTLVASYKGSWNKGHWQGHGTQTLNNGDSYTGDFNESKRTFGEYRWKDQEQTQSSSTIRKQRTYQGEFHDNGRPHGHGKYTWSTIAITSKNGDVTDADLSTKTISTYIGMFENGQRQGHGVFTSSKLQYTGDWLQGKYHGYGVLKIPSKKSTFKGQFHHGVRDGQGEEILEDGTIVHKGLWRRDRPVKEEDLAALEDEVADGSGDEERVPALPTGPVSTVYQTPQEILDGEGILGLYKGIVEDHLPSGVGTITFEKNQHPTGITRYEGFFDQGIRQGYGRADFGNGDTYHGNWSNGIFEGSGEYIFADGRMYKGTWCKGLPHDKGAKFTWPNNDTFVGVYDNGHRKSGRLVFSNGAYYDGEFYSPEGSYGGRGKLVTLMVSYEGEFRDGAFHGQGCLKKNNGFVIYEGTWMDGKALREDVMIAIPEELLDVPLPPPDDDFGAFDDPPDKSNFLSAIKRTISPPLQHDESRPTLSETIMGTSSKLFGTFASNFLSGMEDPAKVQLSHDECKAVVDMPVSDAQDNPGRYVIRRCRR